MNKTLFDSLRWIDFSKGCLFKVLDINGKDLDMTEKSPYVS